MVYVRVQRIMSVNDPETGRPGKQIEFVESRQSTPQVLPGVREDEEKLVRSIVGQFQSMGIFPQKREMVVPKMTLLLSENEYDLLRTHFEVNDTYELVLTDGSISFKKLSEGV